jgi:hypothetical protein
MLKKQRQSNGPARTLHGLWPVAQAADQTNNVYTTATALRHPLKKKKLLLLLCDMGK